MPQSLDLTEPTQPNRAEPMKRRAPRESYWRDSEYEVFGRAHWRMPKRLVIDGWFGELWSESKSRSITSVLTALALHTYPEKAHLPGARRAACPSWTGWSELSTRRTARLLGVNKDSVKIPMQELAEQEVIRLDDDRRGTRHFYQMNPRMYPDSRERFAQLPAALLYRGTWSLLSTAAQHLYLVIACLDPIADEEAYLRTVDIDWDQEPTPQDWTNYDTGSVRRLKQLAFLGEMCRKRIVTRATTRDLARLSRSAHRNALRELTSPLPMGDAYSRPISLVVAGDRWLAVDRWAWRYAVEANTLNRESAVDSLKKKLFPWRPSPSRRAPQTGECNGNDPSHHLLGPDVGRADLMRAIKNPSTTDWDRSRAISWLFDKLKTQKTLQTQAKLSTLLGIKPGHLSMHLSVAAYVDPLRLHGQSVKTMCLSALYEEAKRAKSRARRRTCPTT
jgi:hypothetical protein